MSDLPVVILSTANMNAAVWTNKQHIATHLANERDVHYIESLGLRAPGLNFSDLRRIIDRVVQMFMSRKGLEPVKRKKAVDQELRPIAIHAPPVVPFHRYKLIQLVNSWLIAKVLSPKLPEHYVLWTFSPITYGLENRASLVVYHSVDLLHTIPGIPKQALLANERALIERSDAVVASSKGVARHLETQGARPLLWENVADVGLFEKARSEMRERRAIFVGNLTKTKVDFDVLEAIVKKGVRLVLAGPLSIDGTKRDEAFDRLLNSPLVSYLGTLTQAEMALELGKSWVGIIPYHDNLYTSGVFPMKVYEYLAAGLPVLATPIESLVGQTIDGLTLVDSNGFADHVVTLCEGEYRQPTGNYHSNSWVARLEQIRHLISTAGV